MKVAARSARMTVFGTAIYIGMLHVSGPACAVDERRA